MRSLLFFLTITLSAQAAPKKPPACPQSKKDWQVQGPRILLEKALKQSLPIQVTDFSAKLKKKNSDASGSALPFKGAGAELVLVQVRDKETSISLSGVLKCDPQKHVPVLVSLSYVQGKRSGLVKVVSE
jgi:hypothetical protein